MHDTEIINVRPGVRSDKPWIRDTRTTVTDVQYLAGGMSGDEILADFPYLTGDNIRPCLAL